MVTPACDMSSTKAHSSLQMPPYNLLLVSESLSACRYIVKDLLGQGTFGQVVRCLREDSREEVAVKVIKNQTAFYHQVQSRHSALAAPLSRLKPEQRLLDTSAHLFTRRGCMCFMCPHCSACEVSRQLH